MLIRTFLLLIAFNTLTIVVAQDADSTDTAAPLVRGCYLSVDEYLTNSPSFVDSFYLTFEARYHETWEGTLSRTPRYGGREKKIKGIWGFSDGYDAYIFHQVDYFKLENDSSGLYFYGYDIIDNSKTATVGVAGGLIGGVAGSAIGVAVVIEREKNRSMREKLRYTIHETYGYVIHPDLNKNFVDTSTIPKEEVVFYRFGKKDIPSTINCLANDSIEFVLEPNSTVSILFADGTFDLKLICTCEDQVFTNEIYKLEPYEIDYFKLLIPTRTETPVVEKVSDSEGEFYSESAMKAQEKRERKKSK